jgi:hypothetical protein
MSTLAAVTRGQSASETRVDALSFPRVHPASQEAFCEV